MWDNTIPSCSHRQSCAAHNLLFLDGTTMVYMTNLSVPFFPRLNLVEHWLHCAKLVPHSSDNTMMFSV